MFLLMPRFIYQEIHNNQHYKGVFFQYVCLPFSVLAAPAIFQQTMETVLQGIPNTCVYLDNILITGESDEQHLETLDKALSWLEQGGAHLKKEMLLHATFGVS